jgi:hypothetical protein
MKKSFLRIRAQLGRDWKNFKSCFSIRKTFTRLCDYIPNHKRWLCILLIMFLFAPYLYPVFLIIFIYAKFIRYSIHFIDDLIDLTAWPLEKKRKAWKITSWILFIFLTFFIKVKEFISRVFTIKFWILNIALFLAYLIRKFGEALDALIVWVAKKVRYLYFYCTEILPGIPRRIRRKWKRFKDVIDAKVTRYKQIKFQIKKQFAILFRFLSLLYESRWLLITRTVEYNKVILLHKWRIMQISYKLKIVYLKYKSRRGWIKCKTFFYIYLVDWQWVAALVSFSPTLIFYVIYSFFDSWRKLWLLVRFYWRIKVGRRIKGWRW